MPKVRIKNVLDHQIHEIIEHIKGHYSSSYPNANHSSTKIGHSIFVAIDAGEEFYQFVFFNDIYQSYSLQCSKNVGGMIGDFLNQHETDEWDHDSNLTLEGYSAHYAQEEASANAYNEALRESEHCAEAEREAFAYAVDAHEEKNGIEIAGEQENYDN